MQLNGGTISFLVWVVVGLLGLVNVLVGFVWRLHVKSDDERHASTSSELGRLRDRLHRAENLASECATRLRWMDEDRRHHNQPRDKERRKK